MVGFCANLYSFHTLRKCFSQIVNEKYLVSFELKLLFLAFSKGAIHKRRLLKGRCINLRFGYRPLKKSDISPIARWLISVSSICMIWVFPIKFMYSEKATKFCKIFTLLLTVCTVVKNKMKISQNFVAFSEYMNFMNLRQN